MLKTSEIYRENIHFHNKKNEININLDLIDRFNQNYLNFLNESHSKSSIKFAKVALELIREIFEILLLSAEDGYEKQFYIELRELTVGYIKSEMKWVPKRKKYCSQSQQLTKKMFFL